MSKLRRLLYILNHLLICQLFANWCIQKLLSVFSCQRYPHFSLYFIHYRFLLRIRVSMSCVGVLFALFKAHLLEDHSALLLWFLKFDRRLKGWQFGHSIPEHCNTLHLSHLLLAWLVGVRAVLLLLLCLLELFISDEIVDVAIAEGGSRFNFTNSALCLLRVSVATELLHRKNFRSCVVWELTRFLLLAVSDVIGKLGTQPICKRLLVLVVTLQELLWRWILTCYETTSYMRVEVATHF